MNDKEFSPTPAEFSPPRPEFSAPPREWAAPGNEISRDDTAPPQKKRRSLPAMLVAGAAAVAIGLSCWGAAVTDNTPRAALETVSLALAAAGFQPGTQPELYAAPAETTLALTAGKACVCCR